ncbi:ribonuclease H-like domain-containing protein [Melampsora americana]|nr:ribonuclease H-like domain-containing protein [Melampsora americana]
MSKAHDRLVWIDCEMTGLDLSKEQIIEIACIITDKNLKAIDEGISYVIGVEKKILDQMGEWCTVQHAKSGLTQECLKSSNSLKQVDQLVRDYIEGHIPDSLGQAILAGNSVYADKAFLEKDMPLTAEYLHYRIVDVSSIKELARRWNHDVFLKSKDSSKPSAHRALDDIRDSINELQYYKSHFFSS